MYQGTTNTGVTILNDVLGRIKLDERLKAENNAILRDFLDGFLNEMRKVDSVFNSLYQELYYTGSFYSDLRISKPDEFDINLVLNLSFEDHEFTILPGDSPGEANYAKYQLRKSGNNGVLFESGFLMPENVRNWFQGVIDRALRAYAYALPASFRRVYVREAGPARTITILKRDNTTIDVDLVPVISCTLSPAGNFDSRVATKVGRTLKAFLVPKPYTIRYTTEAKRLWRCHFPYAEEEIMKNAGCAKSVIRLLKLLRDREQWSSLASYYLKTIVMWMIFENAGVYNFWKEDKLPERFLEALQKLQICVQQKNIPYLFDKNCNLIEKMNDREAYNIKNRLNGLIVNISYDTNHLRRIF